MGRGRLLPCRVNLTKDIKECNQVCDVLCIIDTKDSQISSVESLQTRFKELRGADKAFDKIISFIKVQGFEIPVIYSPIEDITDYDDIRVYQRAAAKAMNRAVQSGAVSPALAIPDKAKFENAELCIILGALEELYVPIQLREDCPDKKEKVKALTFLMSNSNAEQIFQEALLIESSRFMARDIAGGDPERMTPKKVEEYVKSYFTDLKVTVINNRDQLVSEYPLFAAVDRAASTVERHSGRIIFLERKCAQAKKSLMLVGKGVTYDTGGADVKAAGTMSSMSRDKCGAAAVAGIMWAVQQLKPKINVVAAMCMVRNSIGEESYLADEIITSRAGVRVRVSHTDAEGRFAMADPLCRMRELATDLPDPHLFTIATLTFHALSTVGWGYSIAVENSVSRKFKQSNHLKTIGDKFGDPLEISTLRPEDFVFNAGQVIGEDLIQINTPSAAHNRGHQVAAAFMMVAAGLDKTGLSSKKPLKYTHLDILASAGEYPKMPTGSPIVAFLKSYIINN